MLRPFTFALLIPFFLLAVSALAEQRFPPPEFETQYDMPATATPTGRASWLQYVDVAVLAGALGTAAWLIHRRRSRKGLIGLSIFSLAYFGFYRTGCICSIGSVQNVALAFGGSGYAVPITVAAFFLLPLAFALFVGRAFCAGVCPHGALQDLLLVKPIKVPLWLESGLGIIPFVYIGAAVLFAATGSAFIICNYDPFVPLFRMGGSILMLSLGGLFVLASLFIGRPYCRFLCPYGALLKVASFVSRRQVTVTPTTCTQCRLCEQSCPYGAMREPEAGLVAPGLLALERRHLARLLWLTPVLMIASGWIASQLAVPLSKLHPTVALAERVPSSEPLVLPPGTQSRDDLALARAQQTPAAILESALAIRRQFSMGGWFLGGWIGLVIGGKLIALSLRRRRTNFEPDSGACFACARCYASCPEGQARSGAIVRPSALPEPAVAAMKTAGGLS